MGAWHGLSVCHVHSAHAHVGEVFLLGLVSANRIINRHAEQQWTREPQRRQEAASGGWFAVQQVFFSNGVTTNAM